MKINGQVLDPEYEEVLVIPKYGTELIFKARAILDFTEFHQLVKAPVPFYKVDKKTGKQEVDYNHKEYSEALKDYNDKYSAYMFIKSISITEGLEWDTVDIHKPDTWKNYTSDLIKSGFSDLEISELIQLVLNANSMNSDRIKQATKDFLASREQENQISSFSQNLEQENI